MKTSEMMEAMSTKFGMYNRLRISVTKTSFAEKNKSFVCGIADPERYGYYIEKSYSSSVRKAVRKFYNSGLWAKVAREHNGL